jgi:hypothetical protein
MFYELTIFNSTPDYETKLDSFAILSDHVYIDNMNIYWRF